MERPFLYTLLRYFITVLIAALACTGCSNHPTSGATAASPEKGIVLEGWRHCTDDGCGRNFFSVYSTFLFLRVDDAPQPNIPTVELAPGVHWIEAFHSWGAGVILGVGNWRNYGFELDAQPGHRYRIEGAPFGCIVPLKKRWVHPVSLRIADTMPSGKQTVRAVPAMEYCTPESHESGTCRMDSDCKSGTCTSFGGVTGFGFCGMPR
ncbi:MAG TPA: hypothetical protein VFM34_08465 [Moraxellaceae bacterium]|nr:hypothetical protein [Moraxellaceae bacterium]